MLETRLREVKCPVWGSTPSKWPTLGLIAGLFGSKAFASSFPWGWVWGFVCGFPAWWLLAWQPLLSYRPSLGTLTMPWGPSSTTTPSGSSLGGSRNSTTFLRDIQWRSERVTRFDQVSSISGPLPAHRLWFSEPQPLAFLWGSMPRKCSQLRFFPSASSSGSGWFSF